MSDRIPKGLFVTFAVLLVGLGFALNAVQPSYDRIQKYSDPKRGSKSGDMYVQLPGQFMVATLTGFKEAVAGLLWIRADEFFHTGQYEAIIPIVRMVTWLDPHNIDVFTTGAWHLDYNFTDEQQMSDKRYIPASIALLKEGIENNPNTWELYFDLGWMHYNKKLMDYRTGLIYLEKACRHDARDPNTGEAIPRPDFLDRMLCYQYEKLGEFDKAEAQMIKARKRIVRLWEVSKKKHLYMDSQALDVTDHNLAELYLRQAWRYGDMDAYRKGVEIMNRLADRPNPSVLKWAVEDTAKDYARRLAANDPPRDALRPLDAGFEVSWQRLRPRVFQIKGKVNLVPMSEYKNLASECFTRAYRNNLKANANRKKMWQDGGRVYWKLADLGYKMPKLDSFNWKLNKDETVVWDSAYVGGGQFSTTVDLSNLADREFYPLVAEKYKLTIWVTPQQPGEPDYIQDRIGWRGEALTDKRYLDTKTMPGFKMLRKEFIISRKELI